MREQGYDLGEPGEIPGTGALPEVEGGEHPDTTAGNALIHALIDAGADGIVSYDAPYVVVTATRR